MTRTGRTGRQASPFAAVEAVGLALPGVTSAVKYDGSPRTTLDDRELLIADAPETYYVTEYYRPHPVVLVRLTGVDREALRDILSVSWRLTAAKARQRGHHA